jgi:hypothetical protein
MMSWLRHESIAIDGAAEKFHLSKIKADLTGKRDKCHLI